MKFAKVHKKFSQKLIHHLDKPNFEHYVFIIIAIYIATTGPKNTEYYLNTSTILNVIFISKRELKISSQFDGIPDLSLSGGCLSVMGASFYIFWPITDVFVVVEDQVLWAGHVMFPFSFAHVVHGAISFVRVVRYVAVLFFTDYFIG